MSGDYGPIPYPEEGALENAAIVKGVTPTRLLAVLFPVWCVDVEATVTEGEPYAVIDRYVERGIAEGRLTTAAQLADFLALDPVIVNRALRFLHAIGHVVQRGAGEWEVTELGLRSLREDTRYTVTVRDRRKLYFDAFTSQPLTRPYYDSRTVTLLDEDGARAVQARRRGPRFHTLVSFRSFDYQALASLAADPQRDRFNLPERIDGPQVVSTPPTVFLPLYVVRAVGGGGRVEHLAYSQVGRDADDDLAPVVAASTVPGLLEGELVAGRNGNDEKSAREWLEKRGLSRWKPTRSDHDTWQLTLPPETFDGDDRVPLTKVGSYQMLGTGFLRLWCASEEVRQRALLERINSYLAYRSQADSADVQDRVDRIARQLDLGTIDLASLGRRARKLGNRGLAAQLARLSSPAPAPG
jgi:hypothetical protein